MSSGNVAASTSAAGSLPSCDEDAVAVSCGIRGCSVVASAPSSSKERLDSPTASEPPVAAVTVRETHVTDRSMKEKAMSPVGPGWAFSDDPSLKLR